MRSSKVMIKGSPFLYLGPNNANNKIPGHVPGTVLATRELVANKTK